jgi:hypothetical protein
MSESLNYIKPTLRQQLEPQQGIPLLRMMFVRCLVNTNTTF